MAISRAMLFLQAQLQQAIYKNESLIEENARLKEELAFFKKLYNDSKEAIDSATEKIDNVLEVVSDDRKTKNEKGLQGNKEVERVQKGTKRKTKSGPDNKSTSDKNVQFTS